MYDSEHDGQGQGDQGSSGAGLGGAHENEKKVRVAIGTTAGFYPKSGFDDVSVNQKIQVELKKAADALKLTNTAGWIVTVPTAGGVSTIDPAKSYADNHLAGEVTLDWGPSEGGGGALRAS